MVNEPVLLALLIRWITEDKSLEEIDSSTADIREVSFNTSPSPPPCPDLSAATRLRIHERQARDPRLRYVTIQLCFKPLYGHPGTCYIDVVV